MIIPDYFEPIVGWRAWSAVNQRQEGALKSLVNGYYWMPGKAVQCRCMCCNGFCKPTMINSSGFYAFKTIKQLLEDNAHRNLNIIGQVYLWGTVVECTRGYRAEFAYPKALITARQYEVELLAKAWRIPVEQGDIEGLYRQAKQKAFNRLIVINGENS